MLSETESNSYNLSKLLSFVQFYLPLKILLPYRIERNVVYSFSGFLVLHLLRYIERGPRGGRRWYSTCVDGATIEFIYPINLRNITDFIGKCLPYHHEVSILLKRKREIVLSLAH